MKDDPQTRVKRADAKAAPSQANGVSPPRYAGSRSWQKSKPRATRQRGPKFLAEAYGLSENPFGVTPDPRYLYQSTTHLEAKASLVVGIECAVGFQALIAPPGMGKTTLLCNILEQFDDVARTAFLFQTQGNSRDFLRYLISELGGEAPDSDVVRMQETINQLLIRERQAGRQTIVIIDEAQNLAPAVLETLRLLSNFETSTDKLLHIILAGQPQLAQKLSSPEAAQLSQRICIVTTLEPFGLEDTGEYIEHRLKVAGYQGSPLFSPEAVAVIWKRSGGIPREINKVCFNSLLLARAAKKIRVDSTTLREVTSDLDLKRIQSCQPLRLNQMLRSQPVSGSQPVNEIVESLAKRIDKLCDAPPPGAVTRAEDSADKKDVLDRAAPKADATAAVPVLPSPEEVTDESAEVPALIATESTDDSSPDAEPAAPAGGNATEVHGPIAEAISNSVDDAAENESDAKDAPEPAADSAEDSADTEGDSAEDPYFDAEAESEAMAVALLESEELQGLPWTRVWLNQRWRAHRAAIYLGLSGLTLLLALVWAPHSSPNSSNPDTAPARSLSEIPRVDPDLAAPFPPPDYHPKARVWLDIRTQLYYCPGSPMYGTTQDGKFTTQQDAHRKNFKPSNHEFCQ